MRILIVEDDERVAGALQAFLARSGYATVHAADGNAALEHLDADTEVVLLDLGLPDVDGIDLCRRIRGRSDVPIVIVTARNQVAELLARIEAVTRRSRPLRTEPDTRVLLHGGAVQIDLVAREVQVGGVPLALTRKEFDIVGVLARYPGVAVPKERLIREVWNTDWRGFGHSLEVHVAAIRKKSGDRAFIETVRGVGYRLAGS